MTLLRSFLFSPGNHRRRMEKALESDADALIFDLEDAVAQTEKPAARAVILEHLGRPRGHRKVYVRVNALSTSWAYDDLNAVVVPGVDGIMLPKVESAADVYVCEYIIAALERSHGMSAGSVDLLGIIEIAKGLAAVPEIARAATRMKRLAFGSADFSNDTGTAWNNENPLLRHGRVQLALASRAAGMEPPFDTVWPLLDDEAGLIAEAQEARAMGYQGKMAIHPKQLAPINAAFSPSAAELAHARKVCDAFAAAQASGSAAIVVDGVFVDYPVLYRAQQLLAAAERLSATASS